MDKRFEVELTKPDYIIGLQALTAELAKQDKYANRRILERLAAITILFIVITVAQPQASLGILVLIVGYFLIEWTMARRWWSSVHGASFDPSIGKQEIQVTDEAITDTSVGRSRRWTWDAVRRVHDRKSAVVIEFAGWDMVILPSRLWPDDEGRSEFIAAVKEKLGAEAVTAMDLPAVMTSDLFRIAAIAAFVDACLVLTLAMPPILRPLASDLGIAWIMVIVMIVAAALGFVAYRAAEAGLDRLHSLSPVGAKIIAHCLIWAFAVWFVAMSLRLI